MTEGEQSYERVVAQLAHMPDVIAQLLRDHEADSTGRCRGCTKPGTGIRIGHVPLPVGAARTGGPGDPPGGQSVSRHRRRPTWRDRSDTVMVLRWWRARISAWLRVRGL
jgi:hypothetical protein